MHEQLKERLDKLVIPVPETGCWLWTNSIDGRGYGQIRVNRKLQRAHRFSYEIYKGEIPKKLSVLHKCDVRRCCNPDHLFLGTQLTNIKDMVRKKRHASQRKTHCKYGHEFTVANTIVWRGERRCRACRKLEKIRYA